MKRGKLLTKKDYDRTKKALAELADAFEEIYNTKAFKAKKKSEERNRKINGVLEDE